MTYIEKLFVILVQFSISALPLSSYSLLYITPLSPFAILLPSFKHLVSFLHHRKVCTLKKTPNRLYF